MSDLPDDVNTENWPEFDAALERVMGEYVKRPYDGPDRGTFNYVLDLVKQHFTGPHINEEMQMMMASALTGGIVAARLDGDEAAVKNGLLDGIASTLTGADQEKERRELEQQRPQPTKRWKPI